MRMCSSTACIEAAVRGWPRPYCQAHARDYPLLLVLKLHYAQCIIRGARDKNNYNYWLLLLQYRYWWLLSNYNFQAKSQGSAFELLKLRDRSLCAKFCIITRWGTTHHWLSMYILPMLITLFIIAVSLECLLGETVINITELCCLVFSSTPSWWVTHLHCNLINCSS